MDNIPQKSAKKLVKTITSVVVVVFTSALLFYVPKTYALETNENTSSHSIKSYTNSSKLSDFIKKFSIFVGDHLASNDNKSNFTDNSIQQNSTCKNDLSIPFIDIQDNQYKDYINTLYSRGVIIGSNNKFMPDNNLDFYCMIKIVVDSYRSKLGYDLKTQLGLSHKNHFPNLSTDIDNISLKYLNTAYELGFLKGIDGFDNILQNYYTNSTSYFIVKKVFENIHNQFPLLIDNEIIKEITNSQKIINRGEFSRYVVDFFGFAPIHLENICQEGEIMFSDTIDHSCKSDIHTLASLGIVNPNSDKFYPDNYLRNYEFIIMLTKTILEKEKRPLEIYVLDYTSRFSDLNPKFDYIKYFEFACRNGLLNYTIDIDSGEMMAKPNQFVTIDQVNQTMSKLFGYQTSFKSNLKNGLITRGEFSTILVSGFNLGQPKSNLNKGNDSSLGNSIINEIGSLIKSVKLISQAYNQKLN